VDNLKLCHMRPYGRVRWWSRGAGNSRTPKEPRLLDSRQAGLFADGTGGLWCARQRKKGSRNAPFCTSHHRAPDAVEYHASKCAAR
jgi:hypothetical protein